VNALVHQDLDALARDAASGALSRRQVLRRLGTGAGLALIALLGSVERTQTAWHGGRFPASSHNHPYICSR
jgi:hypothetical protein